MGEQDLQCSSGLTGGLETLQRAWGERSCTIEPDISAVLVHFQWHGAPYRITGTFVSSLVYLSLFLSFSACHHFNHVFFASSSKRHTRSCFLALSAAVQQDIVKPNWRWEMGQVKSRQIKSYKTHFLLPTSGETRSLLTTQAEGLISYDVCFTCIFVGGSLWIWGLVNVGVVRRRLCKEGARLGESRDFQRCDTQ